MELWGMVLLAAALSIDALNIGASCGFEGIRVPLSARMIMMSVTMIVTAASVGLGTVLHGNVSAMIGKLLSTVMLSVLGLYIAAGAVKSLLKSRKKDKISCHKNGKQTVEGEKGILLDSVRLLGDAEYCDANDSKKIELREALAIGLALSGDSIAAGLGTGLGSGAAVFFVPVMCGLFQMIFLLCGEKCAAKLRGKGKFRPEWLGMAAGLLLTVMAVGKWFA